MAWTGGCQPRARAPAKGPELTLPSVAATHTDIPNLAALDDVVQRLHGLLDRRLIVKAMALQQVDVVEPKALKRVVNTLKDVLARKAMLVDVAKLIGFSVRDQVGVLSGLLGDREVDFAIVALVLFRSQRMKAPGTHVMTTISSRLKLNFLIALPRISSLTPSE